MLVFGVLPRDLGAHAGEEIDGFFEGGNKLINLNSGVVEI